jgi:hypothetical protein
MKSLICTIVLAAAAPAWAQPAPPPPPPGCDSPQSHQFDFWVGRWVVGPTAHPDKQTATSLIEKLYSGCAVRENWSPNAGGAGGSLNSYVTSEHAWKQTWVDAYGARADFTGGWNGHAMVLTGVWPQPGHPTQQTRMTYTPNADGSVRQSGETSDDSGKTWTASFDLTYRRAP